MQISYHGHLHELLQHSCQRSKHLHSSQTSENGNWVLEFQEVWNQDWVWDSDQKTTTMAAELVSPETEIQMAEWEKQNLLELHS